MARKILINAVDSEECRIARVNESKLEEFHSETTAKESVQGNIYKGIVTRIEPSLQAVFVDFGTDRHGFLQMQEIHSDYFQDSQSGDRSLKKIIKRGQELIVQVTKDPSANKGAMLTTFISLPGRHVVLMPGSDNKGVSRQIDDENERVRLKEIMTHLKLPEGYGLIIRTAGENATKTMMVKDFNYLMKLWKDINRNAEKEPAPALLFKEMNLAVRAIRDYLTPDVSEILIDDPNILKEVKAFLKLISPKQGNLVRQHKGDKPIFTKFQLETQIASIFESRVPLPSGGSIVIDQTEALVSIDVNSGKSTKSRNIEETARQTNLEAAEEIARQLRLRDLGGLIVVDFIDMKESKNKIAVETSIKNFLKEDKARSKISRISQFGLLEMSRQRIRPPIEFGNFVTCKHCNGKGMVLSTEAFALAFLRKLNLEILKEGISQAKGYVPPDVASYLLNKKRAELLAIEEKRAITISIEAHGAMLPSESRVICE
jgi:ribonuclease E